ncbi:unnamed protein product [marine sediment metagenome]|uniref:Uncharacterized protein n=1 Tax=marine sediment metagenome TaxID=412755 RepID=X1PE55_9ZZZZ
MLDVLQYCIKEKVPEIEAKATLNAILKTMDLEPDTCINIEATVEENTGVFYFPECQTLRLCSGGHVHYLPGQDKLMEVEPPLSTAEEAPLEV